MGCGCKKNSQSQQQSVQTQNSQQSTPSQTVQEAIKKTVDKYYNKK